ncbi:hypothetical protein TNCV_3896162 [Trichonephila clavipes]|nr:hypothetical protein TNCV_3896162 [Trichonephila clavipes]
MDKPTTSSMTDEHSCIICEKLGSSSENNSDLGDIIKISRGVTTLRTVSSERQNVLLPHLQTDVVYAHKSCFCASYKESTLYEASATFATPPEIKPGSFAQFVHDNADFNINTMKCHVLHKSAEVFKNVNEDLYE